MNKRRGYYTDTTDERWALIGPVLLARKAAHPSVSGHSGGYDYRRIVDAIFHQNRSGCQGFKKSVVEHGRAQGIDVQIVEHNPTDAGFVVQPTRWRVEQTFGILMYFRRLVKDYESNPRISESRALWSITAVIGRRLTVPATRTWHEPRLAAAWMPRTIPERITDREQQVTTACEQIRTRIIEPTARLDGLGAEPADLAPGRKVLLALGGTNRGRPPIPPCPTIPPTSTS